MEQYILIHLMVPIFPYDLRWHAGLGRSSGCNTMIHTYTQAHTHADLTAYARCSITERDKWRQYIFLLKVAVNTMNVQCIYCTCA